MSGSISTVNKSRLSTSTFPETECDTAVSAAHHARNRSVQMRVLFRRLSKNCARREFRSGAPGLRIRKLKTLSNACGLAGTCEGSFGVPSSAFGVLRLTSSFTFSVLRSSIQLWEILCMHIDITRISKLGQLSRPPYKSISGFRITLKGK